MKLAHARAARILAIAISAHKDRKHSTDSWCWKPFKLPS